MRQEKERAASGITAGMTPKEKQAYKRSVKRGWDAINKERIAAYRKATREKHGRNCMSENLRYTYGLTTSDVESMQARQKDRCAICKTPLAFVRRAVDHCHKTGRVRGLLCIACNTGLGQFRDDRKLLLAAAKYLKTEQAQPETELESVANA